MIIKKLNIHIIIYMINYKINKQFYSMNKYNINNLKIVYKFNNKKVKNSIK